MDTMQFETRWVHSRKKNLAFLSMLVLSSLGVFLTHPNSSHTEGNIIFLLSLACLIFSGAAVVEIIRSMRKFSVVVSEKGIEFNELRPWREFSKINFSSNVIELVLENPRFSKVRISPRWMTVEHASHFFRLLKKFAPNVEVCGMND